MLCALLIVTAITACKKDYPKDTPKWLVAKIKEYKKTKTCNTNSSHDITEYVYTDSNETLYIDKYYYSGNLPHKIIYDYSGNIICDKTGYFIGYKDSCGNFLTYKFKQTRYIWECQP
jgi:hypothetical protein